MLYSKYGGEILVIIFSPVLDQCHAPLLVALWSTDRFELDIYLDVRAAFQDLVLRVPVEMPPSVI